MDIRLSLDVPLLSRHISPLQADQAMHRNSALQAVTQQDRLEELEAMQNKRSHATLFVLKRVVNVPGLETCWKDVQR